MKNGESFKFIIKKKKKKSSFRLKWNKNMLIVGI